MPPCRKIIKWSFSDIIVSYLAFLVFSSNVNCKVPMLEYCRFDKFVFAVNLKSLTLKSKRCYEMPFILEVRLYVEQGHIHSPPVANGWAGA